MIYDADIRKNRRAMTSFALIGCRRMVFRFSRSYRPIMAAVAKPGRVLEPARDMTGFTSDLRVTVRQREGSRRMVKCRSRQRLI